MSKDMTIHRDDRTRDVPGQDSDWRVWVSAASTRNFCNDDPLLDWLDEYGKTKGFVSDDEADGHDPRTEFLQFVFGKGTQFEVAVMDHLGRRIQIVRIARGWEEIQDPAAVTRTWDAMCGGAEAVAQAVLWNPQTRTYGAADLIVRSDVLARMFPDALSLGEATIPAPDLPGARWHYRVVEVKFTTLHMLKDGHAASEHREYMAQVWLYNEALGRIQRMIPPCGYLLGRGWEQLKARGNSALERLERVDRDHVLGRKDDSIGELALAACDWVRQMRADGASWDALPEPSVEELRPNMRNTEDAPWHRAKQRIASVLGDLTLLPRVTPQLRRQAIAGGLRRWTDPACSAERLGIAGEGLVSLVDAVIEANQSPATEGVVFPHRVTANSELWREPAVAEFFADFETVSDLDDDFHTFPVKGGQPLIFMVGCGHLADPADPKSWTFKVLTAERLVLDEERRVITDWIAHLRDTCAARGTSLDAARIFHWSPAETSTLTNAYNSAAVRHGFPPWDSLPWVDLLKKVIKAEPVTVRGAFGFGLKAVAKAMNAAGLIETIWGDGPADGLGAMVGAWWCNAEVSRLGGSMRDLDLIRSIEAYNQVDCRVMAEILHFLRTRR